MTRPAAVATVAAFACLVVGLATNAGAAGAGLGQERVGTPAASPARATLLRPYRARAAVADPQITGRRWNVVVVMTDDQNRDQTLDMPYLRRLITRRGVQYPNAFVQTSTCCPSRASFFTGRFIAGTGVQDNEATGAPGGYRVYRAHGNEQRSLPVALHRAGYATGLFGKYLNEYGAVYRGGKPAGWDTWRAFTSLEYGRGYRGFTATFPYGRRGTLVSTDFPHSYSTRWAGNETAKFIRQAPKRKPVFAVYAPYAPHSPAKPEPRYRGSLVDDLWWLGYPGFGTPAGTNRPVWVRRKAPVQATADNKYVRLALRQRESLRSVDDQIANIVAALKRTGRWQRTLFVFMSDNGLMNGVHAERSKYVPYRRATEVPLIVRYGQDRAPLTDSRVAAANVDVAATILAVAGQAGRLGPIDGVPLAGAPGRLGVPLAGSARDDDGFAQRPPYCGWRAADAMFVRYGSGEEEFYDYATDPYEMNNRVADPAVATRVRDLRQLARQACAVPPRGFGPAFDLPTWTYRKKGEPPRVDHTPNPGVDEYPALRGVRPED